MKTVGYAIVGTGYFGAELGRIMKEQEGARIVAVLDPENGQTIAEVEPRLSLLKPEQILFWFFYFHRTSKLPCGQISHPDYKISLEIKETRQSIV